MSNRERPLQDLQHFLPDGTAEQVVAYLRHYKVHLTITRARKTVLGDYRHRIGDYHHRISVNGNLNCYSFLITLLHELAHLLTFEKYGNRVMAHGKEWKLIFGRLLHDFMLMRVFPDDISQAVNRTIHDPAATSCADEGLLRALRKYDQKTPDRIFVEDIPKGSLFRTADGKVFTMGDKLRKRFRCEEVETKKIYLFSPVYEVKWLKDGVS